MLAFEPANRTKHAQITVVNEVDGQPLRERQRGNGDKKARDTLLSDPRVQASSVVGSTPVADYIYWTGAEHGKRVKEA